MVTRWSSRGTWGLQEADTGPSSCVSRSHRDRTRTPTQPAALRPENSDWATLQSRQLTEVGETGGLQPAPPSPPWLCTRLLQRHREKEEGLNYRFDVTGGIHTDTPRMPALRGFYFFRTSATESTAVKAALASGLCEPGPHFGLRQRLTDIYTEWGCLLSRGSTKSALQRYFQAVSFSLPWPSVSHCSAWPMSTTRRGWECALRPQATRESTDQWHQGQNGRWDTTTPRYTSGVKAFQVSRS